MMAPETVVTVDHNKPSNQQAPPHQQNAFGLIKIDVNYFLTPPGILKIVELILGILCMALGSPYYSGWFVFVAIASFITTLMWSLVYFLNVKDALRLPINWVLSELISVGIETLFYLIAMIVMFSITSYYYINGLHGSNIAAAVFALFNTFAYAASAYYLFMEHKNSASAAAA